MTSDDTATGLPMAGEWDDDTLALLKYDPPAVTEPETTSELVLVPGWTQSEWDRRRVQWLKLINAAATHMRQNQHKTPAVLVRDASLMLGFSRAAAIAMSPDGPLAVTDADAGTVYAAMLTPAAQTRVKALEAPAKPAAKTAAAGTRRRRPSQARKTATGGTS